MVHIQVGYIRVKAQVLANTSNSIATYVCGVRIVLSSRRNVITRSLIVRNSSVHLITKSSRGIYSWKCLLSKFSSLIIRKTQSKLKMRLSWGLLLRSPEASDKYTRIHLFWCIILKRILLAKRNKVSFCNHLFLEFKIIIKFSNRQGRR